ncbi:MAG: T9SS type A sorting domain-containing protein, partial [Bacteroidales bacterium]|nr:T9SS type A sorting domain-containing protein [Bacteroidales bacterium]
NVKDIDISPNPATNSLNITSSEVISDIEIVNVMGQVVYCTEVNSDNAVCDVEDLKAGVYIIRIYGTSTASVVCQRKFIKE